MNTRPHIIKGKSISDHRGKVGFNNDFNASEVKRIYFIEHHDLHFLRGWQGHQIEQRWFLYVQGSFEVKAIKIDRWDHPSPNLIAQVYQINFDDVEVLYVQNGYITCLKALEKESRLMVMSDYLFGETDDEHRFDIDYFK